MNEIGFSPGHDRNGRVTMNARDLRNEKRHTLIGKRGYPSIMRKDLGPAPTMNEKLALQDERSASTIFVLSSDSSENATIQLYREGSLTQCSI